MSSIPISAMLRQMRVADFDYNLPEELIAQEPAQQRDASRLLVLHRETGAIEHRMFREVVDYFVSGDVLVVNNSKVIPARLRGRNLRSGGMFEILLLEEKRTDEWWAMMRPGKRARTGTRISILNPRGAESGIVVTILEQNVEGHRLIRFEGTADIVSATQELGEVPLPPYIKRGAGSKRETDRERYQTVYAQPAGSVAAPTAGLHFTPELLTQIQKRGVCLAYVTLHVGLGTFAPVKVDQVEDHPMHAERYALSEQTAELIHQAKMEKRRVIAVGTTTVRVLETVACANNGMLKPGAGSTDIFIFPPYRFKIADCLLTNFHLPRSTLMMLVSAFADQKRSAGRDLVLRAYEEAIRQRYRFFSYGDAMLIC